MIAAMYAVMRGAYGNLEEEIDELVALARTADAWTQGGWSDVLLPKPKPPAVPVIAYANRVGDWLRARTEAGGAE